MKTSIFSSLAVASILFCGISLDANAQRNENPYKDVDAVVTVDADNVYDPALDTRGDMLYTYGRPSYDFNYFVNNKVTKISSPLRIENAEKMTPMEVSVDMFNKYFDIINQNGEHIFITPEEPNAELHLIGKLGGTPKGVHALVFYAKDGNIYEYAKIVTFDEYGNPIDHQNVYYDITAGNNGKQQARKQVCELNEENKFTCLEYEDKDGELVQSKTEGRMYEIMADGNIETTFKVDANE
ncbi:hypothetical protein WAF17_08980 [Bernardetia sp. ABR2-2B]|uniref:hypothetical protein n=1 Tax=Bernardetia sp. ABR2-2B TaxID=3127472 RepID=UPI0030CB3FCA